GALLRLLLGGVGDNQARRGRGLSLVGLDDDPVLQRLDRNLGRGSHGHTLRVLIASSPTRHLAATVVAGAGAAKGRAPAASDRLGTLIGRVLIAGYAGIGTPSRRVPILT